MAPITACGVCFNTTGDPTLLDPHTNEGAQEGWFNSILSDLEANTYYFARSYAQNLAGLAYGNQVSFLTQMQPEICVNDSLLHPFGQIIVGEISATDSLTVWANQIMDNLLISAPEGFQISLNCMDREFGSELILIPETGFIAPTKVYLRFCPTEGGNQSDELTFNSAGLDQQALLLYGTGITSPTVNTLAPIQIGSSFAEVPGFIEHNGWTEILACGICYGLSPDPELDGLHTVTNTSIQDFSSFLEELESDTNYYIRAYATNLAGTAYGQMLSFTTLLGHLDAPDNLIINYQGTDIILFWDAVEEANCYLVYRSEEPQAQFWGEPIAITEDLHWIDPNPSRASFYRVVASSEIIE